MRICIVYDHLYPQTIGGAERWLRDLALRLAEAGHDVTYLTMRHWEKGDTPSLPGVRVVGLVRAGQVYADARRTLAPPVRFGAAVFRHLRRHAADYDVVHSGSFPYFPLLGAACARRGGRFTLTVEWYEVWTRAYWRKYSGALVGTIGWLVQRACIRLDHRAYCMSQLTARRLVAEGYRGQPIVLPGVYAGPTEAVIHASVNPSLIVYAGRHVREKRLDRLVRGFEWARRQRPDLRLELYGDGPDRERVEELVEQLALTAAVGFPGRRSEHEIAAAFAGAACVATASEREGYGLIVVEAAAHGTPSVVVAGPDNAATELVREGVNGAVARDASPEQVGGALLRVLEGGDALRSSTGQWFAEASDQARIDRSLDLLLESYAA